MTKTTTTYFAVATDCCGDHLWSSEGFEAGDFTSAMLIARKLFGATLDGPMLTATCGGCGDRAASVSVTTRDECDECSEAPEAAFCAEFCIRHH